MGRRRERGWGNDKVWWLRGGDLEGERKGRWGILIQEKDGEC